MKKYLFFPIILLIFACNSNSQNETNLIQTKKDTSFISEIDVKCGRFSRELIKQKLQTKIKENKPLFVHIFVPLCDDINQGIVPTGSNLGDGLNLKTNLYWGAMYGIRTHFKRKKDWKFLESKLDYNKDILERIVFKKVFANKTVVYIVADAYRGDRMIECTEDYLNSLAGKNKGKIIVGKDTISTHGNADLLIFNGHDGLMDYEADLRKNIDGIYRDAVVIACVSQVFFERHLVCLNAYPLVTTTDLLPPEAYVAYAVINSWATMKSDEAIRISAGDAMGRVHKISKYATRKMFATGWMKIEDDDE